MNESFSERWAAHKKARKAYKSPPEIQELLGVPPVLLGEDISGTRKPDPSLQPQSGLKIVSSGYSSKI